jgi:CHAD domain-containing protein
MIKSMNGRGTVSVLFSLPSAVGADRVAICGEWNGWAPDRDLMERDAQGFRLVVTLEPGRTYRFRYLLDGFRWENDWDADAYLPNLYGSEDSLVDLRTFVTDVPARRPAATPSESSESPATPASADPASARPATPVEREAKLAAPAGLSLPDMAGLVPGASATRLPVARLDATYYDTADLRLARSGITLRHRGGESGPAWTVKLPEAGRGTELVRREIGFEGTADEIPHPAAELVLASTRARALEPVARLTTVRRPVEIRDGTGRLLAEVVDDTVSVAHGRRTAGHFREIEVELHASGGEGRRLMDAAVWRLVDAGCRAEPPVPKLVRALGESATRPPDVIVPPLGVVTDATVIELVRHATARAVAQIVRYDPGARLGDDEEDVHKLRVAARRLRSDLHSFGPVLDQQRVKSIRTQLSWLGGVVGGVRDTDVLAARLTARLEKLPDVDPVEADQLMSLLEREAGEARATMLAGLRDARYLHLLDALVELAARPPFTKHQVLSVPKSRQLAANIALKPWRRVAAAVDDLGRDPADDALHQVRILAKRARYAAEAAAPLLGPTVARFAGAVADLQDVLGDHQDTVLAEEWLRNALAAYPKRRVTVDRLIALEQSARAARRAEWPSAWRKASAKKLHTWH